MPQALLVAALLLLCALFAALGWTRRARWRELERRLDARREPHGWFAPGAIVGAQFRVEVLKSGRAWRTEVSRRAAGTPGRFVLQPEFFQCGPNWSAAKVPGPRTERLFAWQITLPGFREPSAQQREELRAWLPRESELAALHPLLVRSGARAIHVGDGTVRTSFRGFVTDAARIEGALEALGRLAPAAERRPGARAA